MSERREHKDELSDAPELRKLGRKDPFQVPDAYFEELEERVEGEVWKEDFQSQVLEEVGKNNVFKTPDNYFEGVLATFEKRKQREFEIQPLKSKRIPFYYMAGIAAAIILLVLFLKPDIFPSNSGELEFAELKDLSMDDLLAEVKPEELSEDMILATFDQGAWDDWVEEESENTERIESDEEEIDDLIEGLDVYMLEEELDELN